jgi:hypothetical protein
MSTRKPYPSDVSDEEWEFVAPYLALIRQDAPQRTHDLRGLLRLASGREPEPTAAILDSLSAATMERVPLRVSAAQDTALAFFRVRGLPVDTRLYVSSASFGGTHELERGTVRGERTYGCVPRNRARTPVRPHVQEQHALVALRDILVT